MGRKRCFGFPRLHPRRTNMPSRKGFGLCVNGTRRGRQVSLSYIIHRKQNVDKGLRAIGAHKHKCPSLPMASPAPGHLCQDNQGSGVRCSGPQCRHGALGLLRTECRTHLLPLEMSEKQDVWNPADDFLTHMLPTRRRVKGVKIRAINPPSQRSAAVQD